MAPAYHVAVSPDLIPQGMRNYLIKQAMADPANNIQHALIAGKLTICEVLGGELNCYRLNSCQMVKHSLKVKIRPSILSLRSTTSAEDIVRSFNYDINMDIAIPTLDESTNMHTYECIPFGQDHPMVASTLPMYLPCLWIHLACVLLLVPRGVTHVMSTLKGCLGSRLSWDSHLNIIRFDAVDCRARFFDYTRYKPPDSDITHTKETT